MGILKQLLDAMEEHGVDRKTAAERLFLVDYTGAVGKTGSGDELKDMVASGKEALDGKPLAQVIDAVKPTLLIGCTGKGGLFDEEVVTKMAAGCERPAIFSLSNPTANSECTAEEAYVWTQGKAIFAAGSPMPEVVLEGKRLIPSQCNNMYIFPGVGLGASLAGSKRVTDRMFIKAAEAVSACLSEQELADGRVFPELHTIREVSKAVGIAVYECALEEGVATVYPRERETVPENVNRRFYDPTYVTLARDDK